MADARYGLYAAFGISEDVNVAGGEDVAGGTASGEMTGEGRLRRHLAARIGAVGSLVVAALLLIGPSTGGQTCTEVTTTTRSRPADVQTALTCAPTPQRDLGDVLPLVVLALLLLAGEYLDVRARGLTTLRQDLETHSRRLDDQHRDHEELQRVVVTQLSVPAQHSVNVNVSQDQYQSARAVQEQIEAKVANRQGLESLGSSSRGSVSAKDRSAQRDLESLRSRVLEAYAAVSPYLLLGAARAGDAAPDDPETVHLADRLTPGQREALREWYRDFQREIDTVRRVRNAVAHPPALVSAEDLLATITSADLLRQEAERSLDVAGAHAPRDG